MKFMGRAARMERHHKRHKGGAINLVSMMDIFTILVFFLLVNSNEVEVLPNAKDILLPDSTAEEKPRESVVVLLTDTQVLVQGRPVAELARVNASDALIIPELKAALEDQAGPAILAADGDDAIAEREVTIMGDREIPYRLLKKIMATCTAADYGRLSLAVLQKAENSAGLRVAAAGG
ncbi:MAG TPA: biopolymer transporter ExbD [Gammaproteobacteria bacterium]|nr:biopolymer transporter ExbD [Gammaproteobacteria bacterium]